MTRIILSGAGGRMGQTVAAACDPSCPVVAGVDARQGRDEAFPMYTRYADVKETADVLVDFSHPSALNELLAFALERKLPVVLATTGYSATERRSIASAAEKVPIIQSANFSIGTSVLMELVKHAAVALTDADVEIIESHHRMKADSPSGTALAIAREITAASGCERPLAYGRGPGSEPRARGEIAIHAIRGGTGAGTHTIEFLLDGETVSLTHEALSRDIFARGALQAAKWIIGQEPGLYDVGDMIRSAGLKN